MAPPRKQRDETTAYARRVVKKEIIAGRLVRLACKRHLDDRKREKKARYPYRFNVTLAQNAIEFFPMVEHTKGKFDGQPFVLLDYQRFIIGCLFGWVYKRQERHRHLRRFSIAYIGMGKKNGKTTLAAALGVLLGFFDDEAGAEVYSAATARKQAKLVWEQAKAMVDRAEWKSEEGIETSGTQLTTGTIYQHDTGSKFEPLSSDYGRTDGIMPHGAIVDEFHEHKNRGLWDIITKGKITRSQPLIFAITTAGSDKNTICGEQHDYSEKVLEGIFEDETWFAYIAMPEETDDWKSEASWFKANPSLGTTFTKSKFEKDEFLPAKADATKENSFKRYSLNMWTEQATRWLQMEHWDLCRKPRRLEDLEGQVCFGGLDLARTRDISAFELVFPDGEDFDVLSFFWIPSEGIHERSKRDRVPYMKWIEDNYITATTTHPTTDFAFIESAILGLAKKYQILQIGYDPWHAQDLAMRLEKEGATMVELNQGTKTMGAAREELERLTINHAIRHGGNKVLRWMASNVDVKRDPNGNIVINKSHAIKRIDGIVAVTMALRQAMHYMDEGPEPSIYENIEARPDGFLVFG